VSGERFYSEIYQQPAIIDQLIHSESNNISHIAKSVMGKFDYILIAARGSSDNAARYAQYLLGIQNHIPVALATPSIFTKYEQRIKFGRALVLGISQSGQSPDIIAVLEEARRQNCPTISLTNDLESPIADVAEAVIDLSAGSELALAASKTYTTSLTSLALLSAHLAGDTERLEIINKASEFIEEVLQKVTEKESRIERYRNIDRITVLGRGYNYSTAFEISLKVKELTRVLADPYSTADYLHGPIAMVQDGFPVLLVAPSGKIIEDMQDIIKKIRQRGGEIISISDDTCIQGDSQLSFIIPSNCPEWLSPIVAVIPGQYFALALARFRGLDPDNPDGLSKITETW